MSAALSTKLMSRVQRVQTCDGISRVSAEGTEPTNQLHALMTALRPFPDKKACASEVLLLAERSPFDSSP